MPSLMGPALQRTWGDGTDGPPGASPCTWVSDKLTGVCPPTRDGVAGPLLSSFALKWVLIFSNNQISPDQGLFIFLPVCLSLRVVAGSS